MRVLHPAPGRQKGRGEGAGGAGRPEGLPDPSSHPLGRLFNQELSLTLGPPFKQEGNIWVTANTLVNQGDTEGRLLWPWKPSLAPPLEVRLAEFNSWSNVVLLPSFILLKIDIYVMSVCIHIYLYLQEMYYNLLMCHLLSCLYHLPIIYYLCIYHLCLSVYLAI